MKAKTKRPEFLPSIVQTLSNKLIVSECAVEGKDFSKLSRREHVFEYLNDLIRWSTEDWTIRHAMLDGTYRGNLEWSIFVDESKLLTARGSQAGWAEVGFPILEASNDCYAASLMCTSAEGLSLEDLNVPGATIVFTLPATDMMPSFIATLAIRSLTAYVLEVLFLGLGTSYIMRANSITELLFADSNRSFNDSDEEALSLAKPHDIGVAKATEPRLGTLKEVRRFDLVRNYVAGLLLAYQTQSNHTYEGLALSRAKKLRGFDPRHRIAILGRKTKTDMRSAIRRYIDGETRKGLSFQFIVRGHYRDQACGLNHSSRKVIWIEPFWKGPEDAIIRARAVQFQP